MIAVILPQVMPRSTSRLVPPRLLGDTRRLPVWKSRCQRPPTWETSTTDTHHASARPGFSLTSFALDLDLPSMWRTHAMARGRNLSRNDRTLELPFARRVPPRIECAGVARRTLVKAPLRQVMISGTGFSR